MAERLSGAPVAQALCARMSAGLDRLARRGCVPTVAVVRVGERPADLSYERGFTRRAQSLGIRVLPIVLPETVEEGELTAALRRVNEDGTIPGCLLVRPLPERLSTPAVLSALRPEKDIDAVTSASMGGLMVPGVGGFPPCTATACMELLNHYQVPLRGRKVVLVGGGVTVGMPAAILLMNRGATVSVCNIHTEPAYLAALCRGADLIISAAGKAGLIGRDHVSPGQVVVDVGLSAGADGRLRGDVDFEQVEPIVAAITTVPGGVGAVTSTVLAAHTVQAALAACGLPGMEETRRRHRV